MPVSPHRSGHLWMLINTLRLHNSEDCRTLDFLLIIIIILFHFIILWQENLKKRALFQLPMGEYVLIWDGIMALGLRTKSGMGIQTAHVLVSYSAWGLSVAGEEQLRDRDKGWARPFNVAAQQTAKSRWVKLKSELFPKEKQLKSIFRSWKYAHCSTAQIMSR